jgi:hypothetical protein
MDMNVILLDAGGAGLLYVVLGAFFLFLLAAILIEAGIMQMMRYSTSFKKAFLDSVLINLASVAIGFFLIEAVDNSYSSSEIVNLLILYGVTVVVETFILFLLNKTKPLSKTIGTSVLMNLVTYIILYLITHN